MERANKILSIFQEDDKKAFELLYDTYYESLVLFSNLILNDLEAAEDIVQEFFISFWINKRFETLTTSLEKYVFQAVKYKSLNFIRGNKRQKNLHEYINQDTLDDESIPEKNEADFMENLYQSIDLLPEERRKIFLMICVDGISYQQVADQLGISKNTVKTQMSRALKFLRECLREDYLSAFLLFILKKIK